MGRGRWSYNKCTLVLQQASLPSAVSSDIWQLAVAKAVVASTGGSACDAQVTALYYPGCVAQVYLQEALQSTVGSGKSLQNGLCAAATLPASAREQV